MRQLIVFIGLAFLRGALAIAGEDGTTSCLQLERQALSQLPRESVETFDRTAGSGWRALADIGCFRESEHLIAKYLEEHGEQSSLRIHIAQMQLRQGKNEAAAANFRKSLRQDERPDTPFKFNDFVLALAAFSLHDRVQFDAHHAVLRNGAENFGNRQNLRLLDAIASSFDKPYLTILNALAPAK
ncbi:MAG: hypothetical protein ABWY27_09070 [Telluria sp.]